MAQQKTKKRIFKYYPEDFGKLKAKVIHMDLDFDIYEDRTEVISKLKAKAVENLKFLELNAKSLEIKSVECDKIKIIYEYKTIQNKLVIKFENPIKKSEIFTITTNTICKPTKNILEGMYYDITPDGCPPTIITQCQQWGFQRIVPCIDDMTAKCTYRTSITADSRYTDIITNGDIVEKRKPVPAAKGRDRVVFSNEITPMAPYLFFLGVGTYDTFKREFEYPDGKKFMLELVAPKGSNPEIAEKSLDILYDGIMWIHLFTGPERYKNLKKSKEIFELIKKREQLKKSGKNILEINAEIKKISKNMKLGYKYTGTVYREIGMQNSDFGGMENVGNTTISGNRLMPFKEMTDPIFEYMVRVKIHEFYHNINGSEVTGWSPFEIWLNEAVTVHIEKLAHAYFFGEAYSRVDDAQDLIDPTRGVLLQDAGAASMPIEPDGFNDPNELITGITYVKAPEFVRMIETIIGKEAFVKGLHAYHTRYAHSNATRKQWLACMEEVSGKKFGKMAETWLKRTKFPVVKATTKYDEKKKELLINLIQTNKKTEGKEPACWEFPFVAAWFDRSGKKQEEKIFTVDSKENKFVFKKVNEKPLFVSMNRGYSFYGKLVYEPDEEELFAQSRLDDDYVSKYLAFYKILDIEKTRLIKNPESKPSEKICDFYMDFARNEKLTDEVGGLFFAIMEGVEDQAFAYKYQQLYDTKIRLLKAIAERHKSELLKLYKLYSEKKSEGSYLEKKAKEIKLRQAKNIMLGILSSLDTPDIHALIKKQYKDSENISDRVAALSYYLNGSAKDKLDLLADFEKESKGNPVLWELFLSTVSRCNSDDVTDLIRKVWNSKNFKEEQTNDQRGLFMPFTFNRKKSLMTEKGRNLVKDAWSKIANVNEYTTVISLDAFGVLDSMDAEFQSPNIKVLLEIMNSVDKHKHPSVYNTIRRIITNLPKARKAYEKDYGKIKEI